MKTTISLLNGSMLAAALVWGQEPDNSKNNKRDRDPAAQQSTPQNATETKEDLEVLKNIRKAITDDKDLSTYAHNVKITVKRGAVTLRGPVRAAAERTRIEELSKTHGAVSVINELEIAPSN
jgi:hyperosmotically inducible periplasmic protein